MFIELYSERRRREAGEAADVVQFDLLSGKLRRQLLYIISDVFGAFGGYSDDQHYQFLRDALRRSRGATQLIYGHWSTPGLELEAFIMDATDEEAFDAIELAFRPIRRIALAEYDIRQTEARQAISDFNLVCRREGFGYEIVGGTLVRLDSQVLHNEAVKPALLLLADPIFANAEIEFRSAHRHWRDGNMAEVLVDCLKSFESTVKIIAANLDWPVPERATAKQLVELLFQNNFIPTYYQSHFSGLKAVLESGIATPRNREGGHGAGPSAVSGPDRALVQYVMNLTASTILFLAERFRGGN